MDLPSFVSDLALSLGAVLLGLWLLRTSLLARSLRALVFRRPELRLLAPEEAPLYLREWAAAVGPGLQELGFEDDGPSEVWVITLAPEKRWNWRHEVAGTTVTLALEPGAGQVPLWSLRTDLTDGSVVVTLNTAPTRDPLETPGIHLECVPTGAFEQVWTRHLDRVQAQVDATGSAPRPLDRAAAAAAFADASARVWATEAAARDRYEQVGEDGLRLRWTWLFRRAARDFVQRQKTLQAAVKATPPTVAPSLSEPARLELDLALAQRLETMRQARRLSPRARLLVSAASLVLFLGLMARRDSLEFALLLTGALVFHELGHLVAMRLFGSRDTSLLFIPFLGGVALQNDRPATKPWQEVIMLLAGPVPGLVLGFALLGALLVLPAAALPSWSWMAVAVLLTLNAFNLLLPIAPLDGGQLLQTAFLGRFPRFAALFRSASGLGLIALAAYFGSPLFALLGLFFVSRLRQEWRTADALLDLRRTARAEGFRSSEEEPWLRRVLSRLHAVPALASQDAARVLEAKRLTHLLRQPAAGFGTMLLAAAGWSLPFWLPFAGLPLLNSWALAERERATIAAQAAGLPRERQVEAALRDRLSKLAPEDDARPDYVAASGQRGRGESQVSGVLTPQAWDALVRGSQRKFWPRPPTARGGPLAPEENLVEPDAIGELLGRRLEQALSSDDPAPLAEVSQTAARVFAQLRSSPRFDADRAVPELVGAWCRGLERALVLRARQRKPVPPSVAGLLVGSLPADEALAQELRNALGLSLAHAEASWDRALPRPSRRSDWRTLASDALVALYEPSLLREQTEAARRLAEFAQGWAATPDPWLRLRTFLSHGKEDLATRHLRYRARLWATAAVELDLARGALAWHANWVTSGSPPANLEQMQAAWFQRPAEHPLDRRSWNLEVAARERYRLVLAALPPSQRQSGDVEVEPDDLTTWELSDLKRGR
ncbi:MAG: site-2 protease family protein [Verrucomicrobia bacterium]|nr:site-2 protease family protein [Verrucomicrobiota bacterium]